MGKAQTGGQAGLLYRETRFAERGFFAGREGTKSKDFPLCARMGVPPPLPPLQ